MKTPTTPTQPSAAALRAADEINKLLRHTVCAGIHRDRLAEMIDHEFSHVPALVEALEGVRSRLLAMPDAPTTSTLLAHDKWRLWTDACNIASEALALAKGQP